MDAIEILTAARKKVERPENWGKGIRLHDRPPHTCCTSEAVEEVRPITSGELGRAFRALHNAAGVEYKWRILTAWNDASERTHAEVLAALLGHPGRQREYRDVPHRSARAG